VILIEEIELNKFRNLGRIILSNLKDLNILIGPNNCGKTNILRFVDRLASIYEGGIYDYLCPDCNKHKSGIGGTGIRLELNPDDYYLKAYPKDDEIEVRLVLNKDSVERLVPKILAKQRKLLPEDGCKDIKDDIVLKNRGNALYALHWSPLIHPDILEEIKRILYCPEKRLQEYKGKSFLEFIREKKLTGPPMRRLIDFMSKVVDPRIHDYKNQDLIRNLDGQNLIAPIDEQGSGVRSLVCLAADILTDNNSNLILVDEPELGLNPSAKQEFLKFLLDRTKDRQIFIATQDPAFVNPILWKTYTQRVSVYLFSLQKEQFVRVDLCQSKEDPEAFAGYLPQTTSLRSVHLYVEGTSDVYIFQVLLRKFLDYIELFNARAGISHLDSGVVMVSNVQYDLGNRFEFENKVGIYHLCGDLWSHLLYTIPRRPYRCIVVLDGDKREEVPSIIKKHNESNTNSSKFVFAQSAKEVAEALESDQNYQHPAYCLEKNCIEDYLSVNAQDPSYDKKVNGPQAAGALKELPKELFELFLAISGLQLSSSIFPT
jgi:hypothetical protein